MKYLVVAKWVEAKAVAPEPSEASARFFVNQIVCRFGAPGFLESDRGSGFCYELVKQILSLTETVHRKSTSYAPQTQGLVEEKNWTITSALALYCSLKQNDWDNFIQTCVLAINTSVPGTTRFTPFYLMYGQQVILPDEIALTKFENKRNDETNLEDYTVKLSDALESSREIATARAEKARMKMSLRYGQLHQHVQFEEGDPVSVYNLHRKLRTTNNLNHRFYEPFKIMAKMTPVNYRVRACFGKQQKKHSPCLAH